MYGYQLPYWSELNKKYGAVVLEILKLFLKLYHRRDKNRQKQSHKSPSLSMHDCRTESGGGNIGLRDCSHVGWLTIRTGNTSLGLLSCCSWVEESAERIVKLEQNLDQR